MSLVAKVLLNRDLFTNILSFLSENQLKILVPKFRPNVHYDYIAPTSHTLVYGQVQCGKTSKIMDYIQKYRPSLPKIVVIQNNLFMLNQYIRALKNKNISYKIINNEISTQMYKEEQVLLIIHNKFRMNALVKYLDTNRSAIKKFCLVLDESDQYLKKIQNHRIFKDAKNVLHVTATPFRYQKSFKVDNMVVLKPRNNYVGLNDVEIKEMALFKNPEEPTSVYTTKLRMCINAIIAKDFIKKQAGIMLITCFRFVADMKSEAQRISIKHPTIPVVVLTTTSCVYLNGFVRMQMNEKNVQKLFDRFKNNVILIANRLSNRGVNYTDSSYTKHITHQISLSSNNYTSFIQKCRIFGTRPINSNKPVMYCIVNDNRIGYCEKLKTKLKEMTGKLVITEEPPKASNLTVRILKQICRENKIKKYSKLRKEELIRILQEHNIAI